MQCCTSSQLQIVPAAHPQHSGNTHTFIIIQGEKNPLTALKINAVFSADRETAGFIVMQHSNFPAVNSLLCDIWILKHWHFYSVISIAGANTYSEMKSSVGFFFCSDLISYLLKQVFKGRRIILQQVCRVSGDETHPEQTSVVMGIFFLDHLMKTKIAWKFFSGGKSNFFFYTWQFRASPKESLCSKSANGGGFVLGHPVFSLPFV